MELVALIITVIIILLVIGIGILYVAGQSDDKKNIVDRARELGEDERPGC